MVEHPEQLTPKSAFEIELKVRCVLPAFCDQRRWDSGRDRSSISSQLRFAYMDEQKWPGTLH